MKIAVITFSLLALVLSGVSVALAQTATPRPTASPAATSTPVVPQQAPSTGRG